MMNRLSMLLLVVAAAVLLLLFIASRSHLNVEPHAAEEIEKAKHR